MVCEGSGQVRIGVIGAGMIGQIAYIRNFAQNPSCRLTALAELRPELGRLAAEKCGVPIVYPSHRELLADPAVDAVAVVTRRPATGPIVLDALNAGKHVLSEKPMAHSVAQAERLVAAASAKELRYAVGFMKRHDAGTALAKTLIEQFKQTGELGRIVLVRAYCFGGEFACGANDFVMTDEPRPEGLDLWPIGPDWMCRSYTDALDDYAWFVNVYVHDINIVRYLLGTDMTVTGTDLTRRNGRVVTLDTGEFPVVLEVAEIAFHEWQEGVEIYFERGRLSLVFASPMRSNMPAKVTVEGAKLGRREHDVPWSSSFQRQAAAFISDVRQQTKPVASGEDSLADMRLIEDIWRHHLNPGERRGMVAI